MNTPLRNRFATQLKALTGFDFQKAVIKIFHFKYGETGFTELRNKKDKGNDGIVEKEKRVIACYGPQHNPNTKKRQKEFEDKAKGDFDQYKQYWKSNYPKWSVVINHQIDPEYDSIIKGLYSRVTVIGLGQLLTMVENLKNYQKRSLGAYLRIESEAFATDYIKEILEDMLKEEEDLTISPDYTPKDLVQIEEKLNLNFSEIQLNEVKEEYESYLLDGIFNQVNSLLYGYDDSEIKRVKRRVIYDYSYKSSGRTKERLKQLTTLYLDKYSGEMDDDYLYYIRGVLLYLFEQCLIGEKTEKEK